VGKNESSFGRNNKNEKKVVGVKEITRGKEGTDFGGVPF